MKRNLAIILLTCLLVSCLALFTACTSSGHTHTVEKVEAVAATCETEGSIEYYRCTDCDKLFSDESATTEIEPESVIVAALGHDEESHDAKAATCTEDGWNAYVNCKRDGCDYTTKVVIPAAHTEVDDGAVAPTCTEKGKTAGKHCSVCEEVIVAQQDVPALNHDYDSEVTTQPTCTEKGVRTYTCKRTGCEHTYTEDVNALDHDIENHDGKPATCTEEGYEAYKTCKRNGCNYTTYQKLDKIPHTYDKEVASSDYLAQEATVLAPATYYKSCVCGEKGTETFTHGDVLTLDPREDANAIKAEAEDAVISGTSHYPNVTPDMIESDDKASGGKAIGCFDVVGNTAVWKFNFAENAEDVVIYFYAKALVNTTTSGFGISVDGETVAWNNIYFENTAALDNPYRFYASKPFSVTKGVHSVKLEVLDAAGDKCAVNFDYIMLAGYGDVKVGFDNAAPVVTDIALDKTTVGEESTITYTVSDNVTALENLTVSVKVYYDYQGKNQEEVTVTNGKFTSAKDGWYTVVVTATDETGNTSIVTNRFACGSPDDPNFIKVEAESAAIVGESAYPDYCSTMQEANVAASGGYELGCFAVNGNTATWNLTLYQAHEGVTIAFVMKGYCAHEDMSGFKLTVNGTELAWAEGTKLISSYTEAHPYLEYVTVPFNVVKGQLIISLEILDKTKANANVDYLTVYLTARERVKVEAESGEILGTSQYPGYCPSMVEESDKSSGGKEIGCFAVNGNTATWKVDLAKDYSNVTITFSMKSFINTEDMSGFKVTVNGVEISWDEGVKLVNTQPNYVDYSTASFSAEQGELVITIEVVDAAKATANIDYLTIDLLN